MLEKEDKEWIVNLITGLLDRQTRDLCQVMAEGFAQVVTLDYLDKRLFDFKERRMNEPIKQLKTIDLNILEELKAQKVINPKRANSIASMHPFPQKLASS